MMIILFVCMLTATLTGCRAGNENVSEIGCFAEDGRYCSWDTEFQLKCTTQGSSSAGCVNLDNTKCSWDDGMDVSCGPTQDNGITGMKVSRVSLTFNGTFEFHVDTSVKHRRFINLFENFLLIIMEMKANRIVDIILKPGSIIAAFTVLPDPQGIVTTESALKKLEDRLKSGPLILIDNDGTVFTTKPEENGGFEYTDVGGCTVESCQEVVNTCIDGNNYMCTCTAGRSGDFCDQEDEESSGLGNGNVNNLVIIMATIPVLILLVGIILGFIGWKRSTTAERNFNGRGRDSFNMPQHWKPQSDAHRYPYQEPKFSYQDRM